jgi:FtsZ-binding cell division protein ZapB
MKKKMLNLFKKIFKMATKQELEQQIADAIVVAQKLGAENKQLRQMNEDLTSANKQLTEDFNSAVERVRYLDGQVRMLESQKNAQTQYSDSDRNY